MAEWHNQVCFPRHHHLGSSVRGSWRTEDLGVIKTSLELPYSSDGKESACQHRRHWSVPWVGKIPWRREWLPTPVFLSVETHSSVLAWRIPGTEEPGGLPSMGSHRVGHDWSDLAAAAAESHEQRNLVGYSPGGNKELDTTEWLSSNNKNTH